VAGVLALAAIALMFPGGTSQRGRVVEPSRTVTVTGEGEVRVRPDLAQLTFGVITHGASATEAEALVLASARQIQTALVQAGADDQTVEPSHAAVVTNTYQDYTGVVRIGSFQGRSAVRGTVRTLSKVQASIDAGLAAGATSLESVVYLLENPEPAKESAMKAALENARERASVIVRSDGERLGPLKSMEVLLEEAPPTAGASPGSLLFRAKVKATFEY